MKVSVQLHNGEERVYEHVTGVIEKDKYSIYIYGKNNQILAILNKSDVSNLFTEEKSD